MRASAALRQLADGLLGVVWAPRCAACDAVLERPTAGAVCAACWRAVVRITAPLCDRCGAPLAASGVCPRCAAGPARAAPVARHRAAGWYDGSLREIVHAYKYQGRQSLAEPLAALMREAGRDLLAAADLVVPVPLHPRRRWARGFDQAHELAARLGLPLGGVLRRVRHTRAQSTLAARRRRANVRGAFALAGRRPSLARAAVGGRVVVLADDVRTTGATLDACARVLRAAGARAVWALTVARVEDRPPRRPPPPPPAADARRPPAASRALAPGAGSSP